MAAFLLLSALSLAFGLGWFSYEVADVGSIIILLALNVVVAVVSFRAANRTSGTTKWGWSLYAAGATGIVLGVAVLLTLISVRGLSFNVAGFNLFLFIMANVLGVAALALLLPPSVTRGLHARLVLDALIVAGCAFALIWIAGADQLYAEAEGPWSQRVIDFSYPFVNTLMLTLVVVAVAKARNEITPSLWLLFLGVAIVSVTDPFFTWFSLNGQDVSASMIGSVGATAVILTQILAAIRATDPANPTVTRRKLPNLFAQGFPLVPVGVALPAVAILYATTGTLGAVVFWTSAIVVTLLLVRLGLTLADNRQLAIQLEATAELKSQMLGFISHEMANPLTPLRVQLYTLAQRDSVNRTADDRSLEIANRSVNRLTTLARDARSLTQLEAGALKLDRQEHDVNDIVTAAFDAAEAAAEERNVSLEFEGAMEPMHASIDVERMGQVFDNLLSNALKFTPAGGKIIVGVRGDAYSAIVTVNDSGLGMTKEQLGQLFKPFSRVHGNVAPGTGLGLYICRGIIESHGGEIWADSQGAGRGSSFHVRLPLAAARFGQRRPEPRRPTPSNIRTV